MIVAGGLKLEPDERRRIERLLFDEPELLNQGLYEQWLALFTVDGIYWVPASPGQTDPLDEVSLFYEDRPLMEMRIARLRHPQAHTQKRPPRTSRVTGAALVEAADGDALVARCRFQMSEYHDERERSFAGRYRYLLRPDGDGYRIALKRVDLINCNGMLEAIEIFI